LSVHRPLTIQAIELEGSSDPRRSVGAGQRLKSLLRGRQTIVLHRLGRHVEAQ
jgi:hypothetical protein